MRRHHLPLILAACLLLPGPAPAQHADPADPAPSETSLQLRAHRVDDPSTLREAEIPRLRVLHASTDPLQTLGLFAQGHGFTVGPRATLYDLEGGASLLLDEGVHLTASYRLIGLDLGFDGDLDTPDMQPSIAAPFLGLAFDF